MFTLEKHGNMILRQAVFGHFFTRNKVACAYHSLKLETIYFATELLPHLLQTTTKTIVSVYNSLPASDRQAFLAILERLCGVNILVPAQFNEFYYLEEVRKTMFRGPNIRVMVLHLSDYCPLKCRYCFVEGALPDGYQRKDMSNAVIEAAIDRFGQLTNNRRYAKRPSIVFYGGEPLANWPTLLHGLEYLKMRQQAGIIKTEIDKVVITNGVMLTESIAQELKKHGVMVSMSIDGPQPLHDANRITRKNEGSFGKAMQGFYTLLKANIKPTVSCVVSKNSVEHIEEIVDFLLGNLGVTALGFNHVSIVPEINFYDPEYEQEFARALIKAQEIIQEKYPDVYERRMNYKINHFLDSHILRADCTGCGEQMSISPDGMVGICQGYMGSRKTFTNSIMNPNYDPHQDPIFMEWSNRSPLNMPECYACPAIATCGGGCPRNADLINGSIHCLDSAFCHFAKLAQEWMIWKKFDHL